MGTMDDLFDGSDSHLLDDDDAAFAEDERARIAALHKSAPEVIWLQVDPEAEQFDGWEAQTWCSDKINETDVKYVRADLTPNMISTTSPVRESGDLSNNAEKAE